MGYVLTFAVFLASLFIVDYLSRCERGGKCGRWAAASVIIGPLVIPLIYLVQGRAYARQEHEYHAPRP